jgi:hypothetical protein
LAWIYLGVILMLSFQCLLFFLIFLHSTLYIYLINVVSLCFYVRFDTWTWKIWKGLFWWNWIRRGSRYNWFNFLHLPYVARQFSVSQFVTFFWRFSRKWIFFFHHFFPFFSCRSVKNKSPSI